MKKKQVWFVLLLAILLLVPSAGVSAKSKKAVAKIGKKTYTTVAKAVKSVKKGQTIKLMANASLNMEYDEVWKNTKFTIDLNKKVLTVGSDNKPHELRIDRGNITIKNGTLKAWDIYLRKKAKVTFSNVTFKDLTAKTLGKKFTYMTNINTEDSSSLTLKKCKMNLKSNVDVDEGAAVTIQGGTYGELYLYCNGKKVNISGGTFKQIMRTGVGNALVKNVSVDGREYKKEGPDGRCGISVNRGTLTLQNCKYKGTISGLSVGENGKLVVNGGTYTLEGYHYSGGRWVYGTMLENRGKAVINSGTFKRGGREEEWDTGIHNIAGGKLTAGPKVKWINCN